MALRMYDAASGMFKYVTGMAADPLRFFEPFIPGTLAQGPDIQSFSVLSTFAARTLKRVSARLETPSTSGDVTFRLELYTGRGTFAATQTSDTFTIPQGQQEPNADYSAFTNGLSANGNDKVRVYIITAGTGAANLGIRTEW